MTPAPPPTLNQRALAALNWRRDFRPDPEIAAALGCSLVTVKRWRKAHGIAGYMARALAAAQVRR